MNKNKTLKDTNFLVSSDPEIMVMDVSGEIKSSIPILKTDKNKPIVLDESIGAKTFADNSLAEFSFNPSSSKTELITKYQKTFQKLQDFLGKKHRILVKSAHFFKESDLESAYGINPLEVGCNPEFNFYKREVNQLGSFTDTMRSGSAHIHLSSSMLKEIEEKENALKLIEIFVGAASVLWDNDESSIIRRKKYGTSGSCRFPEGDGRIEARFMSNYVLNSPELISLAYDLIEHALSFMLDGKEKETIALVNELDVQNCINNCDKKLAFKILKQVKLPKSLMSRVTEQSNKKYSTEDFYANWKIKV